MPVLTRNSIKQFLLTLPQPILVFGTMLVVASACLYRWCDVELLTLILIVMPLPLIMIAERIWTKRTDWLLTPKELAEDAFWVVTSALIWVPFYSNYYTTPISRAVKALRDHSPVSITLNPQSLFGLVLVAVILVSLNEFIYYWLHRLQHKYLFFWRIHATHHHITKMGAARGDRTHPFEFLALMFGAPIVLVLAGASDNVIAVYGAFYFFSVYLNHSNLPLRSGLYGVFFTTPEQHHLHHAYDLDTGNTNFGCSVIIWDRIFGTYCSGTAHEVTRVGAGSGKALSLWTQYKIAFESKRKLTKY